MGNSDIAPSQKRHTVVSDSFRFSAPSDQEDCPISQDADDVECNYELDVSGHGGGSDHQRLHSGDDINHNSDLDDNDDEDQHEFGSTSRRPLSEATTFEAADLSPDMVSLLTRCQKSQSPMFHALRSAYRFTNLSRRISDWTAFDLPHLIKNSGSRTRLPLGVMMSLCLNEYFAMSNIPGRVRHAQAQTSGHLKSSCNTLYFALRAWAKEEIEAWENWSPLRRLVVSGVFHPFLWSDGNTSVVPIQIILQSSRRRTRHGDSGLQRFEISLPGTSFSDLRGGDRQTMFILLLAGPRLVAIDRRELCLLPIVRDPRDEVETGKIEELLHSSGPVIAESNAVRRMRGMVRIVLLLQPASHTCADWVQRHELSPVSLETAFFERCQDGILDEDARNLAMPWSDVYDEITTPEDNSGAQPEGKGGKKQKKQRKEKTWTLEQENLCCELLNDGTRLGLDDDAALKEASARLAKRGHKYNPQAISEWFQRLNNEWKPIHSLTSTTSWVIPRLDAVATVSPMPRMSDIASFSNLSTINPFTSRPNAAPTVPVWESWLPEEEEACIILMSEVEHDLSIEDTMKEVSARMWQYYGFRRSEHAVRHRWCNKLRPESERELKIYRFHDWKPKEVEACQTLSDTFSGLPIIQRCLEISKSMKSAYGFERSAHGVRYKLDELRRLASNRQEDGVNHGGNDESKTNSREGDDKDAGGSDDAHGNIDTTGNDGKHHLDVRTASPSSSHLRLLKENEEEDAEEEQEEGQTSTKRKKKNAVNEDKMASTTRWTDVQEQICKRLKKQVMQLPEFADKGLDAVMDEVAKRARDYGIERTGRGIKNRLYKNEKAARKAAGNEDAPQPRWTKTRREALLSLMEEHSTIADMMERFQTVAEKMRSSFGYPCSASQVKSKWYEHKRKNKDK